MEDAIIQGIAGGFISLLFAVGAILFFKLMRRPWQRAQRYLAQGGAAEGMVVGHSAGQYSQDHPTRKLVIEYRDGAGRALRIKSPNADTHPLPIGTAIPVAYDPSQPEHGVVVDQARRMARIGTWLAALLALLAALNTAALIAYIAFRALA